MDDRAAVYYRETTDYTFRLMDARQARDRRDWYPLDWAQRTSEEREQIEKEIAWLENEEDIQRSQHVYEQLAEKITYQIRAGEAWRKARAEALLVTVVDPRSRRTRLVPVNQLVD